MINSFELDYRALQGQDRNPSHQNLIFSRKKYKKKGKGMKIFIIDEDNQNWGGG